MVDFPVDGFDMSPHLANKKNSINMSDNQTPVILGGIGWSPWKRQRKHSQPMDSVYDLYGVCYHHGTDLETGHYTAACKNPYNNQWYLYDDTKITNLSQQSDNINAELVNNSAYILFYQKRNGMYITSGTNNSSSAASTSSVGSVNEHWIHRMPKFCYKATKPDSTNEKDGDNNRGTSNTENEPAKLDVDAKNCQNSQESVALRTSQVTLQINNSEPPKKPLYTTSIYINSSGNVDITTTCEKPADERTRWFNGNRGYDTLSSISRYQRDAMEYEKRYHSDDEAPPVRMEWVSYL